MSLRDALGLLLSVALPWTAGAFCVRAIVRRDVESRTLLCLGYGYPLGLFATTLVMRLLDLIGLRFALAWIASTLLALGLAAWWLAGAPRTRRAWRQGTAGVFAVLPPASRGLAWFFLALCVADVAVVALEAMSSLLLPFDAWVQWASKARVWYEYGHLVPFVSGSTWVAFPNPMQFTDVHPEYPATVSLFEVWTAVALGRWDETLVNAPWVVAYCALGMAFYAQLRRIGSGPLKAIAGTYVILSLPFLQVHAAVAGMADIFVALAYALSATALWQWTLTRQRHDAVLAVLMAILCASLKLEGGLWVVTLVPAVVTALNRRIGFALAATAAAIALAYLAFGPSHVTILGYGVRTQFENVSLPIFQHLFVMDNWHLFWYALAAMIVVNFRLLLRPELAPMTMTVAAGVGFICIVFFFSGASVGVDEEGVLNRLLLHCVPALVFYVFLVAREAQRAAAARAAPSLASA
jgi:hypothetical protein